MELVLSLELGEGSVQLESVKNRMSCRLDSSFILKFDTNDY